MPLTILITVDVMVVTADVPSLRYIVIIEIRQYKKLSYCWETVRRESMPRIAKMDVEMTT